MRAELGIYMFDVRDHAEWEKEHVQGTINIPLSKLEARLNEPKFNKLRRAFFFGTQSSGFEDAFQGAQIAKKVGFPKYFVIEGGVKEMVKSGFYYDAEKESIFY